MPPSKSTIDPTLPPLHPSFSPPKTSPTGSEDSPNLKKIIAHLNLQPHIEGGYFVETDRDPLLIPSPFAPTTETPSTANPSPTRAGTAAATAGETRHASTSIHYLLTPSQPLGAFHRNRGRTIHTLHHGRGRYVIIHADEIASPSCAKGYGGPSDLAESERWVGKARVETFVVGSDVLRGERVQWIVEGGKYKASFLLADDAEGGRESGGLLISETVVPGFEYGDHDFLRGERLGELVGMEQAGEMGWLLREG
ncbi:hypothetical protein LTR62_006391 [Meristemomyces frigidus]|uniref:DUF985 domain-containing protein n=1 Tax=Meristemomyces frigidus TaxID=1508187 RepID=A0AAN7YPZ4_9PEZI|nr:hypothetical protein LTR62_006391 [Meristemomyces frigidus]